MFAATAARVIALRVAGYRVIEKWECQNEKTREPLPKKRKRELTPRHFLRFRIVPRQNEADRGEARPVLQKRARADFDEPRRHAGPRAQAHL